MIPHLCPNCGIDLDDNLPRTDGDLEFSILGDVKYKGHPVSLTQYEKKVLLTLLKGAGNFVHIEAIKNRVYGEDVAEMMDGNHICVFITRLRQKFQKVDPTFDRIETRRRGWGSTGGDGGYRWRMDLVQ